MTQCFKTSVTIQCETFFTREQSSKNSSKESPKMSYQETQTYEADFATPV